MSRTYSAAAAALLAIQVLSGCDDKKPEPSSRPAAFYDYKRSAGTASASSSESQTQTLKTLVTAYGASQAIGVSSLEDAFSQAGVLFDGSADRSSEIVLAEATPARNYSSTGSGRETFVRTAPARDWSGTGGMPLPEFDGDFGSRPDEPDDDGGGPTLLGFAAFQIEQNFPSVAPIMSRLGWSAVKRRGTATAHTPYRVTVHHTQTQRPMTEEETAKIVKNIQSYHMKGRAKSGLENFDDIGYHFLIAGDGRVIEGRRAEVLGAHARGANDGNIGISMLGDFNKMLPTGEQVESLTRLITYLSIKYRKDPLAKGFLEPHQRYDPTDCPGKNLMAILESLRARIDQRADTIVADGSFKPLAVIGG